MRKENFLHVKMNPESNYGPAITFYWQYDSKEKKVLFTAALCSKHDIFSKKIAREICRGRMRKGYVDQFPMVSDNLKYDYPKNKDVINEIIHLYNEDKISWECILKGARVPNYFDKYIEMD
ncbi:MAG: hypothetical protein KatS3mg002_0228 [Candidatus Woesearchaeota archaeon]|nr:MAG: hypothetical protein KatS3mg002_0228 [Candidatus Woesearchaeota archaeon]